MKPNILLITADQWRGDCLSALGHPSVRTPHIDALAAEGTLFARHYAGAAPCSPARASLYTGLYQMNHRVCRNGSPLDDRFDNIARMARRAGYDPTLFGYTDVSLDPRKLAPGDAHLTTYEGVLPGFSVRELLPEHEKPWLSWLRSRGHAEATSRDVHAAPGGGASNAAPRYGADETQTAYLTDAFLRWLSEQEAPWFSHLSFLRPHPPFVVPEPYNTMFAPPEHAAFRRHADRQAEASLHPFVAYQLSRTKQSDFVHGAVGPLSDWSADDFATLRAVYYGMIAEVDAQIGRLVAGLKAAGAWERTIVILCSDHGEMAGDHWLFGKGGFFEASYHIPLVIRDPDAPATAQRRIVRDFTSAADIMPTLAQRLGQALLNHQDGRSLIPFLAGERPSGWRDAAFWEFDFRDIEHGAAEAHFGLDSPRCNLAVLRDDRFKYVHFAGLPPLFFNLSEDTGEMRDLSREPAYASVRLDFAERLLSLRAAHLDQTLAGTMLTAAGPVTRGAAG